MQQAPLIVDGHEDLAMGALAEGRNYLTSARQIRADEAAAGYENPNGVCMLGLQDWLAARVAIVVATVATIPRAQANPGELSYATIEGAHQQGLAHVDLYRRWAASSPHVELVYDRTGLDRVLDSWVGERPASERKVGLVLLMEGADPIRDAAEVPFWAEQGVRLIGPAWRSNRYTPDSDEGGPLTAPGRQLLVEMSTARVGLDITHMSEQASLEVLDRFEGVVLASHAHSRRTVATPRLLSDRVIKAIVDRDGIVGVMPLNWALREGWQVSNGKAAVTLEAVADAIDTVCQVAGDAAHTGLGTDFDGGQGSECAPAELDTIADLPKLASTLRGRGYSEDDIAGIMGQNWISLLKERLLPGAS
jgi:membrane dipeptidase